MKNLYEKWLGAKKQEEFWKEERRKIEDSILEKDPDKSGFEVKITERVNRKVNSDLLQELATENGLTEHLSHLFRWKAEINSKEWKSADESITKVLEEAITSTPGRASFKIKKIESTEGRK